MWSPDRRHCDGEGAFQGYSVHARCPKERLSNWKPLKPATIELETDLAYGLCIVAYRLPGYRDSDFAAAQILADVVEK